MPVRFDPSAIRAELKTEDDHWVAAIEMATGGSWGNGMLQSRTSQSAQ